MEEDFGHRRGALFDGGELGAFARVDRLEGKVQGALVGSGGDVG